MNKVKLFYELFLITKQLTFACQYEKWEEAKELIIKGANINEKDDVSVFLNFITYCLEWMGE